MKKICLLFCCTCLATALSAQDTEKKKIDHTVYDSWNVLANPQLSPYGNWAVYEQNPQKGDGKLMLYNSTLEKTDTFERGYGAAFSPTADFLALKIKTTQDTIRKLKLEKKKPDEYPADTLGIYLTGSGKLVKEAPLKSYVLPKDSSSWIAWQKAKEKKPAEKAKTEPEKPAQTDTQKKKKEKCSCRRKKNVAEPTKPTTPAQKAKPKVRDVFELVLQNPISDTKITFKNTTEYALSDNGKTLSYITLTGDTTDSCSVFVYYPGNQSKQRIFYKQGTAKSIALSKKGNYAAFMFSADTGKVKNYELYMWHGGLNEAELVVGSAHTALPQYWCVNQHGKLSFTENELRLTFETAPCLPKEEKDTIPEDEKPKVDIWHWDDPLLQTEQLHNLENDKKKGYKALYHISDKKIVQLGSEKLETVYVAEDGESDWGIGYDYSPYKKLSMWKRMGYRDAYIINVHTGEARLAVQNKTPVVGLSPFGKFIVWFNTDNNNWHAVRTSDLKDTCLTCGIKATFHNDENDYPAPSFPYGFGAWAENDTYFLLHEKYDIWQIDPNGKEKPVSLTQNYGKKNKTIFRYLNTNTERNWIALTDTIFLSATNDITKASAFYTASLTQKNLFENKKTCDCNLEKLVFLKARKNNIFLFRPMSFTQYPDIVVGDFSFTNLKTISSANSQQKEFAWGSVELISWKDFKGKEQKGMLYKPDDFNPAKKYPMIVYFYEKMSDNLHYYHSPKPSHSTIGMSEYVSNGYLIFVPDISYTVGQPGQSAYNTIISGTKHLITKGFVNDKKIGLQGQSWGGYQTAYLITQTSMYAAAMAGAPVSNMTSAYGGIRWESGSSRMTQYEHGQSRLGKTLWDGLDLYIKNSPLFFVDKVKTPVLIMANDNDGAVPWYQGIEFYAALRRLEKPAWMLNYNGDQHNLMKYPNRTDLSIRMRQFFDHYLLDAPPAEWMIKGVPALEKGKNYGLKLVEEK